MERRSRKPRTVALRVQRQREEACAACDFSGRSCAGKTGCRLWRCRWRSQVRSEKGRCALGNQEFPQHSHLAPRWPAL